MLRETTPRSPSEGPLTVIGSAMILHRFSKRGSYLHSLSGYIAAAGLVAWTGSAWPDLAVAGLIALLFLHSAYEIVTGARRELGER